MTERPPHAGLRHVALNVADLEKMEQFYCDVMGYSVEWRPDPDNVYLGSGNDNLALHRALHDKLRSPQSLDHIGIIIDDIDDVGRWYKFLLGRDVKLHNEPRTHRDGARSFYCEDPEGNAIQMIYHPPISGMPFFQHRPREV